MLLFRLKISWRKRPVLKHRAYNFLTPCITLLAGEMHPQIIVWTMYQVITLKPLILNCQSSSGQHLCSHGHKQNEVK